MQLPYSDDLEVRYLSRLFDNKSECYKLFWFQAIVSRIVEGYDSFTYEELVNEMIADAWYMVSEYHLNLGPKDNLEAVVLRLCEITSFKSSEKKQVLLDYLKECTDKEVIRLKKVLTLNVPYRLQAPFMESMKGKAWEVGKEKLVQRINAEKRLMYYFDSFKGINTRIRIRREWMDYITKNREIMKGWIQFHMVQYLQKRNPSVPGIVEKLYPPQVRKLDKVAKYWRLILSLNPVYEIYDNEKLTEKDISIDHFVPWSYVAHDEFWNLHPTTRSINSKKSNYLPDWNRYFPALCHLEYLSYQMIWKYEVIHNEFEKCSKEHLNNDEIRGRLYREGLEKQEFEERLSEIIMPVYQSAKNMGFQNWVFDEGK